MHAVRAALQDAEQRLSRAGIANAATETRWLLAGALDSDSSAVLTRTELTDQQRRSFEALVDRRCTREPLQHVLGRAAFRYLDLHVGRGVFVPRPETELLVELVLHHIKALEHPVVVDLCSGSGAIGLAIAAEAPASRVTLLERSTAALHWLHRNVAEQPTSVRARIDVVQADVATTSSRIALGQLIGSTDAVVVNPPYVPERTQIGLEVDHDPPEAVFGGADGFDLFPAISDLALALLRPGGQLALEHDETHPDALAGYLSAHGWLTVQAVADLTGRPRFTTARRA